MKVDYSCKCGYAFTPVSPLFRRTDTCPRCGDTLTINVSTTGSLNYVNQNPNNQGCTNTTGGYNATLEGSLHPCVEAPSIVATVKKNIVAFT